MEIDQNICHFAYIPALHVYWIFLQSDGTKYPNDSIKKYIITTLTNFWTISIAKLKTLFYDGSS